MLGPEQINVLVQSLSDDLLEKPRIPAVGKEAETLVVILLRQYVTFLELLEIDEEALLSASETEQAQNQAQFIATIRQVLHVVLGNLTDDLIIDIQWLDSFVKQANDQDQWQAVVSEVIRTRLVNKTTNSYV